MEHQGLGSSLELLQILLQWLLPRISNTDSRCQLVHSERTWLKDVTDGRQWPRGNENFVQMPHFLC